MPRSTAYYRALSPTTSSARPQAFTAYLRSIGSSDQSLKRQIRGELAWERLQRRQIEPFVNVGDDEVQAVIDRLNAVARHRRISCRRDLHVGDARRRCRRSGPMPTNIVQQIRNGANFQAYARQFSEASTAALGGDLGWVRAEQLPDELAGVDPADAGRRDQRADPGPGRGLDHRARSTSARSLIADPRDAVLSLMQMSVALPAGSTRAQAEARGQQLGAGHPGDGRLRPRRRRPPQTIGAEVVANDQVRVRDLPPALQQMLLGLSVGQATQPFGSAERLSVLVLCGRDDPPPAAARQSGPDRRIRWRRSGSTAARSATCAIFAATRWSTIAERLASPLAVALGDPAGIGPEIIAKSWERRREESLPPFFAVGSVSAVRAVWDGPIDDDRGPARRLRAVSTGRCRSSGSRPTPRSCPAGPTSKAPATRSIRSNSRSA